MPQLIGRAVVVTVATTGVCYVAATAVVLAIDHWKFVYCGAKNRGWV